MSRGEAVERPDGRSVGFLDLGPPDGLPVVWCHGGPGSRFEPATLASAATAAGLRLIGIDRPGYGLSTPQPGRSIADWVPDALAVVGQLGIDRFTTVGVSTGGSYALALASLQPERMIAAVACCSITDMRWNEGRAMVTARQIAGIWEAPDRESALAIALEYWGEDGTRVATRPAEGEPLPPADQELFADPAYLTSMLESLPHMFAFGVQGYADDRIADGVGWGSFDVSRITCPVLVLHGSADSIVPVAFARHTAALVAGARLRIVEGRGHFSIVPEVVPELARLLGS